MLHDSFVKPGHIYYYMGYHIIVDRIDNYNNVYYSLLADEYSTMYSRALGYAERKWKLIN